VVAIVEGDTDDVVILVVGTVIVVVEGDTDEVVVSIGLTDGSKCSPSRFRIFSIQS